MNAFATIRHIVDMHLNINDLPSSNLLADNLQSFLSHGGLLQTNPDQFILFIANQKPVSQAISVYNPLFWEFLQVKGASFKEVFAVKTTREELIKFLEKGGPELPQFLNPIDDHKKNFEAQFAWSQKNFSIGTLKKTVPVTRFDFSITRQFQFRTHLLAALKQNSPNRLYGYWTLESGFLGASPETLATWDGKVFSTMALAGTWKTEDDLSIAEVDAKTREEHEFVINDIRERLKKNKFEKINIGETHVLKLPVLSHLKTDITLNCESKEKFIATMMSLHPTAALGIYPRDPQLAQEFSRFSLQSERQTFGSPFGIIGSNFAFVVVAIRNLMWSKNRVMLHAGCGVTAQSKLESEWQELQTKKNAIQEAFSLQIR